MAGSGEDLKSGDTPKEGVYRRRQPGGQRAVGDQPVSSN